MNFLGRIDAKKCRDPALSFTEQGDIFYDAIMDLV